MLILLLPYLAGLVYRQLLPLPGGDLPVLMPLLGIWAIQGSHAGLASLGTFWGYVVSPVHLCQLLTVEYFKVPLGAVLPPYGLDRRRGLRPYPLFFLTLLSQRIQGALIFPGSCFPFTGEMNRPAGGCLKAKTLMLGINANYRNIYTNKRPDDVFSSTFKEGNMIWRAIS